MDLSKSYIGKVIKMQYDYFGTDRTKVGYVFNQKPDGKYTKFFICLTNGTIWTPRFSPDEKLTISSVRMDKDLRDALKVLGDAAKQRDAFLERFEAEKIRHNRNIDVARDAILEISGELNSKDFRDAAEKLFRDRFPTTGGFHRERYFSCTSLSEKEITMTHIQDIEKYVRPEDYPFIRREYDGVLFTMPDHPEYKKFCERNAPRIIPTLKTSKATTVDASIGDKNFLMVSRSYTFPLKHGFTKKSLSELEAMLDGKEVSAKTATASKPSLNSAIQSASSRAGSKSSATKKQKTDKQR